MCTYGGRKEEGAVASWFCWEMRTILGENPIPLTIVESGTPINDSACFRESSLTTMKSGPVINLPTELPNHCPTDAPIR
ncbi:hypothetical protein PoB_006145100 [Plakobranchus ocellatus]|uniref:Uncharacterized protein n=1 Tax=Plakobranchus ocellatus TaxID=259542 RepID=A0AAV4CSS6_9GAST|nr:hypothetical protein PoB_006145100 [Plakobranchus ocellatus]